MNFKEFALWLHGYFEIENPQYLDESQTQVIRQKLEGLFIKVTPDRTAQKDSKEWNFPDSCDASPYIKSIRELAEQPRFNRPQALC